MKNWQYLFHTTRKKAILAHFLLFGLVGVWVLFYPLHLWPQEQPPKTGWGYYRDAKAAYQKKDYSGYLEGVKKAMALVPGFDYFKYDMACASALTGKKTDALQYLHLVAQMGLVVPVEGNKDFDTLKEVPEFKILLKKLAANAAATNNSQVAFTVPEKDLIPEGITYNPKTETFYVTSVYKRKIIRITREGVVSDFIQEKQDGFWGGVGLRVDIPRQLLWVNTASGDQMKDYAEIKAGRAAIFKYDLSSGQLLKKYEPADDKDHLFNDLVINEKGDVFITDSLGSALYVIYADRDVLETFMDSDLVGTANGITLSTDGRYLFLAQYGGVTRVEIAKKIARVIQHDENHTLMGIDGLYFYKGDLIAVQNYGGLNRVARFDLNENLDTATSVKVLEANHTLFIIPTTGVIIGNSFYYIANSQLASFNPDHTLYAADRLKEVKILKLELN